jgi:hypothetical protein
MAAPTVTSVSPSYGGAAGGDSVTITGTNFTAATAVKFGSTNATAYTVVGATSITATTPAGTPGKVHVYVTNVDGTNTASDADYYEFVGLFSLAEARAFDKGQVANTALYSDATVAAKEAAIRARFERIIGTALLPTAHTEYYDGDGSSKLYLAHHNPWLEATPRPVTLTSVTTIASDDTETAFTASELSNVVKYPHKLVRRSGAFASGYRNIKVVYTTGYVTCPADIKMAALLACVQELVPTNIPSSVTDGMDGTINWSRVKDPARGRWYGNESIDAVLREHRAAEMGFGIA